MSRRKSISSKKKGTRFDSKFYKSSERTNVRMERKSWTTRTGAKRNATENEIDGMLANILKYTEL